MLKDLIAKIRYKVRYGSQVEWFNFLYMITRKKHAYIPRIASIDETIDKIITDKCSISRFGDGEVMLTLSHKNIRYQVGSEELAAKLTEILTSDVEGHLIGLSDTFRDLYRYNRKARRFWRTHFYLFENLWLDRLNPDQQYYNTFVSRPYMDFADRSQSMGWFKHLKQAWEDRDIVFIEGAKSRLGVGNDLFDNARSIRRIIGPPQNAFEKRDEIIREATKLDKGVLIVLALGPAATVLAYELHKQGYQSLDMGHVDVEYEWCKLGVATKVNLAAKNVNEVSGGNTVTDAGDEYRSQIIAQIK